MLLDVLHADSPEGSIPPLDSWVRDLYRSGVSVLAASTREPSRQLDEYRNGAFARGLLEALDKPGDVSGSTGTVPVLTFDGLRDAVASRVARLTEGGQIVRGYTPNAETGQLPVFLPGDPHESNPPAGQ